MAAFASCRRSGAVRVMVLLLCALFIFATLGAPAAQALGVESVAVFGLASVLSAATAALGFKLASNERGQATLQKMVQDFKTVAWATGFVLVGSKLNGLQNGMDYIKMQVKNGKTYLDSRVFAWVQQWLAENGVYDVGSFSQPLFSGSSTFSHTFVPSDFYTGVSVGSILSTYGISVPSSWSSDFLSYVLPSGFALAFRYSNSGVLEELSYGLVDVSKSYDFHITAGGGTYWPDAGDFTSTLYTVGSTSFLINSYYNKGYPGGATSFTVAGPNGARYTSSKLYGTNIGNMSASNDTGLSGTDTLGKDVIDLTLDQILEKLKEWAQDWFDAGADSATNAATGAQDLPLTVATGAATANPSIAEDGPLVWFPSFGVPIPTLRTGETDTNTVDQGKENANTADKTEAAAGTVEETQTIVDSLLNWASDYISPDKGLFSKFPLCIPYDAYLLVCSALGVDALGVDDVVGSSPGDVQSVMGSGVEVYSNFQPVINFKHELKAGGTTYPIAFTLDLSPFEPIVKLNRIFVTVYVLAELIASEYKRIRSS